MQGQFSKILEQFLRVLNHRRVRLIAAACVFSLCIAGAAWLRLAHPGLEARLRDDALWFVPVDDGDGPADSGPKNRLRDQHTNRSGFKLSGDEVQAARQLAQSVLATARNFYVDAERVNEKQLAELLIKVLRKSNPELQAALPAGGLVTLVVDGGVLRYPVTVSGLVEAAVAATAVQYGNLDGPSLVNRIRALLHDLVAELDPHSAVLSPSGYSELRQGTDGSFGGLGVLVTLKDRLLTVVKPLPNSPAVRAGIMAGDRIVKINGQPTFGMALEDLMDFMRGNPGTSVNMRILRPGKQVPLDLVLKREIIQVDSVTAAPVPDSKLKILHITVETFSAKTSREILSAIKDFKQVNGALEGLVLDLRSNPGGLLDQAVQVADLFLEDGVIVSTRGRRQEVELAGKGYDETDFPMVVLVDEESASASEIVAGALQDHGRAVVVGRPSFGKGSVQTVFELPFDVALKLTIARYYTPTNRSIQNVGIVPDLWLQPVSALDTNMNLLGTSRYRNESFLLHTLDARSGENDGMRKHLLDLDQKLSGPCCAKSYFLERKSDPDGLDEELAAASSIIAANQLQASPVRTQAASSTSKLPNGLDVVTDRVRETITDVSNWLKQRFGVKWEAANDKGQLLEIATNPAALEFKVEMLTSQTGFEKANGDSSSAGIKYDESRVLWTVTNKSKLAVRRLSVFLRTTGSGGDTQESLVGSIDPGESRSGSFSVRLPFSPVETNWEIDAGVAIDAWPVPLLTRSMQIAVPARDSPSLAVSSSLINEKGGVANGVLDPGETATLHIVISNLSKIDVRDLVVLLTNLSGDRISLPEDSRLKTVIPPGGTTFVDVPVVFHGGSASGEIDVGIALDSSSMGAPLYQQLTLPVSSIAGRFGALGSGSLE
jgi:carboxyl-terminal processing protease